MGIKKSVATVHGADATYWNIGEVRQNYHNKICDVTLYGYVSEEARRDGKTPLSSRSFKFTEEDGYTSDATRADIYELIKKSKQFTIQEEAKGEFEGAKDAK